MKTERRPWIMRTYSGHSTPAASNALYRKNLEKGQTGLSVAFDLPTQTGYDPDHPLARGEVGKVGVPVAHLGDMRALFADIPLERMNTSMTINATAPWLFALYLALAEERGLDVKKLAGTTQNDLVKEYLSRGTYVFAPEHSLRLTSDVVTFAVEHVPEWNPTNVCSYHLQEAGATPVQELAYALLTAMGVLDRVRDSVKSAVNSRVDLGKVVGRISFFVNAGVRFVEEMCKMRAFGQMWDRLTRERYGVEDAKLRRFRYGVQVNSLGLTAAQPENNVVRIVLEMLAVTLSEKARARAVQLPAWNEALGLPRPWDQQWSLRAQQILAFESDLLDYPDLFDGSKVVEAKVAELERGAWAEIASILEIDGHDGGPPHPEAMPSVTAQLVRAITSGKIKERLVTSNAERFARIEAGEQVVVGVNKYKETEASPLTEGGKESILSVNPDVEREAIERLAAFRATRDEAKVTSALAELARVAASGENVMPVSIVCAHAGVTTGEWAGTLRKVFGEWRAPTGVVSAPAGGYASGDVSDGSLAGDLLATLRADVARLGEELGRPPKMLVGKPGLDGHSNGAEQIALRARDAGFEVVYEGIRVSPEELVTSAIEEGVHLVGLSILSGSHLELVPAILDGLREAGADIPVVVGGIIPDEDAARLRALGVARVFTPKDFAMAGILHDLVAVVRTAHASSAA
jgi:(2R)-ethylmalonyl-CoA mutase